MTRLPAILLLAAALAAAPVASRSAAVAPTSAPVSSMAAAPAPESCPAGWPVLPPEMAGWVARTPLAAARSPAGLGAARLGLGRGVDAGLQPADAVSYAATPGRPAGPGGRAGLLALEVTAPGAYALGLSSAAWIDVVDAAGGQVSSTAHGRGPPCSGLRKVVDFPLKPGRYVVQLTTAGDLSVGVLAFRR